MAHITTPTLAQVQASMTTAHDLALGNTQFPVPSFNQYFGSGASILDPRITFSRAGTSTYIDSLGVLKTAAVNIPVFENGGFRLRPAETNLFFPSDIATPSSIQAAAFTTTTETQADPTGTSRAVTILTTTGSAGSARYGDTVSGTASTAYAGSIFVRTDGAAISASIAVNGSTAVSVTIGSSWTRISANAAGAAGTNRYFDLSVVAGAAGQRIFVAAVQIEVGSAASPYIPTTTAAVTRPADSAIIRGVDFAGAFNPLEGALIVDFTNDVLGATTVAPVRLQGQGINPIWLSCFANLNMVVNVYGSSSNDQTVVHPTWNNGRVRVGVAWNIGSVATFYDGNKIMEKAIGFTPVVPNAYFVEDSAITSHTLRIFTTRPTDAQLQAMTTL